MELRRRDCEGPLDPGEAERGKRGSGARGAPRPQTVWFCTDVVLVQSRGTSKAGPGILQPSHSEWIPDPTST